MARKVCFRPTIATRFVIILISSIIILTQMLLKENLGQPCGGQGSGPCEAFLPCNQPGGASCEAVEDRIAKLETVKDRLPVYLVLVVFGGLTFIVTNCLLCLRRARWISRLETGNKLEQYERQFKDAIKNKISNYEKSMTDIEMRIQTMSTGKTYIKMKYGSTKNSILREVNHSYNSWEKQTDKGLRKSLKRIKKELKYLYRMRKV